MFAGPRDLPWISLQKAGAADNVDPFIDSEARRLSLPFQKENIKHRLPLEERSLLLISKFQVDSLSHSGDIQTVLELAPGTIFSQVYGEVKANIPEFSKVWPFFCLFGTSTHKLPVPGFSSHFLTCGFRYLQESINKNSKN